MKKKIIGLFVILGIFLTMLGLIIGRAKYVFSSKKFYDEKEMEQIYKDGYDKGSFENRDEALYEKLDKCIIENFELKALNESLKSDNSTKQNMIENNLQTIETLNNQISVLNDNAEENSETIAELIALKNELENQNKIYVYEISQNNAVIEENNSKIAQLESSIAYYENYIAGLETETEVFAIFRVENQIFNIQKVNKNGLAYLENQPEDTESYIFNGWKVNGESVDLNVYELSCNTTFTADLTYKYQVKFMVDDEVYNSQFIVENEIIELPSVPVKEGYVFKGWSLDAFNVFDFSNYKVNSNTIIYAVFEEKLKSGLYNDENIMISSWRDLINDDYLRVSDGTLSAGSNVTNLSGNLIISDEISRLGYRVFEDCVNLTSLVIPDSVTYIGGYITSNCSNLKSITIGKGVEKIENLAFPLCRNLTEIRFNASNCADFTANSSIFAYAGLNVETLTIIFGENVNRIPAYLFSMNDESYISNLTSVVINEGVEIIGADAFVNCKNLISVTIPSSIKIIEKEAFDGCINLVSVTIPSSVEKIEKKAFGGCVKLSTIYIPNSVIEIGGMYWYESIFSGCKSSLVIYCGYSEKPSNWSENWNCYASKKFLNVKFNYTYSQYLDEIEIN